MWIVVLLTRPTIVWPFRSNFFPRRIYYKKDAENLVEEVRRHGGTAKIEKETKLKPVFTDEENTQMFQRIMKKGTDAKG